MNRRAFMRASAAACVAMIGSRSGFPQPPRRRAVMTVLGPVSPGELGSVLPHEHALVDFSGADRVSTTRYDANEAFETILPHLARARDLGCRSFVDCTPAHLGRNPRLLQRLSRASGLHIVTNTGYYGAGKDRYVPWHAYRESVDALADGWVREWAEGIEGTGVKPGFIKTGVDSAPLSRIDRRLVCAAARAHARTGLTIASHTGSTAAALDQLDLLASEGVDPRAFIWVHAQSDWQAEARVEAARRGAWIEIDHLSAETVSECVGRASELKAAGVLNRVLVSHDAGWYRPGEPRGGRFRGFETLFSAFLPALRQAGWTAGEVRQLVVSNPADAFAVQL